jgi:hypothetical protein
MVPPGNETGRPTASLIRRPSPDPPRSALTSHGQNPWPADAPRKPNSPRPAYSIIKNPQAIPPRPKTLRSCGCCLALQRAGWSHLRPVSVPLLEPTPWVLRPDLDRTPPTTVARDGDASVDRWPTLSTATRIPNISGESRQKTWRQNESAVPPPPGPRLKPPFRPRPPTAVSNPTETKQSQKPNAASSQTGVRPPPPLRSLTPTHLMDPAT